jgi:hypothetical protein
MISSSSSSSKNNNNNNNNNSSSSINTARLHSPRPLSHARRTVSRTPRPRSYRTASTTANRSKRAAAMSSCPHNTTQASHDAPPRQHDGAEAPTLNMPPAQSRTPPAPKHELCPIQSELRQKRPRQQLNDSTTAAHAPATYQSPIPAGRRCRCAKHDAPAVALQLRRPQPSLMPETAAHTRRQRIHVTRRGMSVRPARRGRLL